MHCAPPPAAPTLTKTCTFAANQQIHTAGSNSIISNHALLAEALSVLTVAMLQLQANSNSPKWQGKFLQATFPRYYSRDAKQVKIRCVLK